MELSEKQFNKLLTKEDGKKYVTKEYFDEKIDTLFTLIDGFTKRVDDLDTEMTANKGAHSRFEKNFTLMKKQIKKVEKVV